MKDIFLAIGFLLILAAPIAALGWLVYRSVKRGGGGDDYSLKITGVNAGLVLALVLTVTLGCGWLGKKQEPGQNLPKTQKFREVRTSGTITSANTGGSCMKKINGVMKTMPEVGFSYSVGGVSYNGTGCANGSSPAVGTKVEVCYITTTPPTAEICSTP